MHHILDNMDGLSRSEILAAFPCRKPTKIGIPLPSRIPQQLSVETVLYPSIGYQISHVRRRADNRPVCSVNTTGWAGKRVDRLSDMAERIYARGEL